MIIKSLKPLLLIVVALFCLTACGGKDYAYVDPNEDHTTPGLLSGEDGVFHIIDYQKKDGEEATATEGVEEAS